MTDLDKMYIERIANDDAMRTAIQHFVEEFIENKTYPIKVEESNEMIGARFRAEYTGRKLIKDALHEIATMKKVEKKEEINSAV